MPSQASTAPDRKPLRFPDTNASLLLDLLRGLAAVLVMLSHWRALFFVDFREIPGPHRNWAWFYLLTGAGHQAVILFFVLSGYFISGSIFRALERNTWTWPSYLVHRLARLWTVLVPGLLVCLALDWIGTHLGPSPARYFGQVAFVPDIRPSLNSLAFLGNLAFLQTLRVPMFGSDSALWSLAYEFWYYLLFPLLWLSLVRRYAVAGRLVCGFAAILLSAFVGPHVLWDLPVWLAGTVLALLPAPPNFPPWARPVATVLYLPVFFLIVDVDALPEIAKHYLLALASLGLLWVLLSATSAAVDGWVTMAIRRLSRFSFTLYVVHIPLLMLLTSWLVPGRRWFPTPAHLALALPSALLSLAFAYGLASVTEFHTDRVRSVAERRLGLQPVSPVTPHLRVLN